MKDCAKGHRAAHATKFSGARKAKFQVAGWFETDLLSMHQRPRGILIARQLSKEKIPFHGPQEAENPRKLKGRYLACAGHVDRLGIVAEEQCATVVRCPPQALLAKREIPAVEVEGHIGIEQPKLVLASKWRRGLQRIIVGPCDHLANRKRVGGSRG